VCVSVCVCCVCVCVCVCGDRHTHTLFSQKVLGLHPGRKIGSPVF